MTPIQLVREECANHQPDNSCLGMMINPDLSITGGRPLPRCLMADSKRCPYFEECVAPMADMATDPRRAAALQEAVAEYRQMTNQKAPRSRPCPECGAPMQKGRRSCPKCRIRPSKLRGCPGRPLYASPPTTHSNAIGDSHPPQDGTSTVDISHSTEAA